MTKSVVEERLGNVSQEKQFWCHDGRYLKNLKELEAALEQKAEETFRYHANDAKSDFNNWVRVSSEMKSYQETCKIMPPGPGSKKRS